MYYIGVDGGGTKTKFVLCDECGKIMNSIELPTANYIQVGYVKLTEIFKNGVETLLIKENLKRSDIANAYIGCSGFGDVEKEEKIIKKYIKKAFKDIKHQVGNDGENAMVGALAGKEGINIVSGTGSIAYGYNSETSKVDKCGGWHQLIGSDEGSGYWISIELLKAFQKQSDGRKQRTRLYETVKKELKLKEDGEIITRVVEEWKMDRTKIASLSKIVTKLCKENDKDALEIVNKAALELADITISLYKKLDFKKSIYVTYTGGVWNMGNIILTPFKEKIQKYNMKVVKPVFDPGKGSLILALRNNGIKIDRKIIYNLKNIDKI